MVEIHIVDINVHTDTLMIISNLSFRSTDPWICSCADIEHLSIFDYFDDIVAQPDQPKSMILFLGLHLPHLLPVGKHSMDKSLKILRRLAWSWSFLILAISHQKFGNSGARRHYNIVWVMQVNMISFGIHMKNVMDDALIFHCAIPISRWYSTFSVNKYSITLNMKLFTDN